jgi:hypothetical protein
VLILASSYAVTWTQFFSVFLATADPWQHLSPISISWQTKHPWSPAKAEDSQQHESETVISEAASMLLVTSSFSGNFDYCSSSKSFSILFHESSLFNAEQGHGLDWYVAAESQPVMRCLLRSTLSSWICNLCRNSHCKTNCANLQRLKWHPVLCFAC